jgi:5-formyltetrahydrofolate cyclo-ligase
MQTLPEWIFSFIEPFHEYPQNPINNMENKSTLRKGIAARKRQYTPEQRAALSAILLNRLEQHPRFAAAHTLLLYHSLPDEVHTAEFIRKWSTTKRIILPVVVGDDLELRIYEGEDSMRKGAFNILEPTGTLFTNYEELDLAVIPGVAFDADGNRLGRGKGYYDRLLSRLPSTLYKIGICYDFQKLPHIPAEPHDRVMDEVI